MPITHGEMIRLHRLRQPEDDFLLNPDLVMAVESTPDTVITLTTHTKVIVRETPEDIIAAIRRWRASVLTEAVGMAPRGGAALALIRGASGDVRGAEEQ